MSSSISVALQDQIVYATPWYQRMYSTNSPSLDEEIENRIIQTVANGEITRVPSANAVYEFVLNQLLSGVDANLLNISNLNEIFTSTELQDILVELNTRISTMTAYTGSFTMKSSIPAVRHVIEHNLNSEFILYNIMIWNGSRYVNDIVSVIEENANTLVVESLEPINIKSVIIKI